MYACMELVEIYDRSAGLQTYVCFLRFDGGSEGFSVSTS